MFHDTHAHLDHLLQRLGKLPNNKDLNLENGIISHISEFEIDKVFIEDLISIYDFVIHPTISSDNFWLAYSLFHSFKNIYFLMGTHPEVVNEKFNITSYLDKQRDLIVKIESDNKMSEKLIGIGEVGLDYYYTQDKKLIQTQIGLFEEQIRLAIKLKLPIVIHCRKAFDDLFSVLNEYPEIHGHFLIHCYTENVDVLRKVLDLGGKIGIGGIATYKSATDLQNAIKFCPNDSFMLETDLPFLAPHPKRGEVCVPDMIRLVAKKIAELKNLDDQKIWDLSLQNSRRLFGEYL